MTTLFPHQYEILARLRDPSCPPRGAVVAPVGSGIRHPVVIRLCEVASDSVALVLCGSVAMAQQWALLLREEGAPVLRLDSAQAALEVLEERPKHPTGVVVTTFQRLLRGPSSRVLADLDYALVVLDDVPSGLLDRVEWLPARAQRLLLLTSKAQLDSAFERWPIVWTTTYEQLVNEGHMAVTDVPYELTSEERTVRDDAIRVLQDSAARRGHLSAPHGDSVPALHAMLLALASDPTESQLSERAWAVLDRMEAMRTVDSRLVAVDKLAQQATENGGRCVIMAYARADVRYIADHLASLGKTPSAVIDAMTPGEDRRSALRELAPGGLIVATTVLCEPADLWPARITVVLWPTPNRRRQVPSELSLVVEARPDIAIHALHSAETTD